MNMWLLAAGLAVLAATGLVARIVRRHRGGDFTTEPLSGEWLANARARDDQHW
jgi:hypothetical protein